jgi:hypothetical protein
VSPVGVTNHFNDLAQKIGFKTDRCPTFPQLCAAGRAWIRSDGLAAADAGPACSVGRSPSLGCQLTRFSRGYGTWREHSTGGPARRPRCGCYPGVLDDTTMDHRSMTAACSKGHAHRTASCRPQPRKDAEGLNLPLQSCRKRHSRRSSPISIAIESISASKVIHAIQAVIRPLPWETTSQDLLNPC